MNSNDFVSKSGDSFYPIKEETVLSSLMQRYKIVIIESLITAFGLDRMILDQHGGDVDTIHSVRQIESDPDMEYKNPQNQANYENRGPYNRASVTGPGTRYQQMRHEARKAYGEDNSRTVKDAYEDKELHFLGGSEGRPIDKNANLDHVIPVKKIFDDRARSLSCILTEELANDKDNLQWTNEHLNKSMRDDMGEDYVSKHPELPESVKENILRYQRQAIDSYERRLARTYYLSPQFANDVYTAAGKTAAKMGVRQAVGFMMSEVVFSVLEVIDRQAEENEFDMSVFLVNIAEAVKDGFKKAVQKYEDLFGRLIEGAVSGALSTLTTTIWNIFTTTAKDTVRIIRQSSVSLVKAGEVLFINPNDYLLGEKLCETAKILAIGGAVVAGTIVGETINKSPASALPYVGEAIQIFCSSFVTGTMTCTILLYFDRSKLVGKLAEQLDKASVSKLLVRDLKKQVEEFEAYAAEIMSLDIEAFRKEVLLFGDTFVRFGLAETEEEKNKILKEMYIIMGLKLPWSSYSSFDEFLSDTETYVFE